MSTKRAVALTLLAIVFAVGLTWSAIELPRLANKALQQAYEFPGFDPGHRHQEAEAFYDRYYLREIGYTALSLVALLIAAGFVAERRGLASAGAVLLFLPIFGHFAIGMFFLASLGLLRVVWMPALDFAPQLLRLGDIAYVPYMLLVYPAAVIGVDVRGPLPWVVMGIGMTHFVLGVVAWSHARLSGRSTADFWVYRFSRHPQYLGWIVWSYGLLLFTTDHPEFNMKLTWSISHTLPWLLSALVIVGVALLEEIRMQLDYGDAYCAYARRTPFLLPLPRALVAILTFPARLVLRGKPPRSGRQVLLILAVYAFILVLLSLPFMLLHWPPRGGWWAYPYNVYPFR